MAAPLVVVASGEEAMRPRAADLASGLGLTLLDAPHALDRVEPGTLVLRVAADRLELVDPGDARGAGLSVDFSALDLRPSSRSLSRRQPLARAIGARARTVADATAGLGYDAALLAALGYHVTAIERHPVVAALLADGLRRAVADDAISGALGGRLSILVGESATHLAALRPPPDVVYIDPMFPPKRKRSALPPKRVRLIRALVGDDEDAPALLEAARRVAARRVVLKRPTHVAPLDAATIASYGGKLVRYDVYGPLRP